MDIPDDAIIYCPVCAKNILAENFIEVAEGVEYAYAFLHDDVEHDEHDLEALMYGIQ